jgi:cytochrome c biogenesis protein
VIRKVSRYITRLLASAGLAVGLLVFVGLWSLLATFVPQGEAATPAVAAWAKSHALLEPLVRAIGLHQAFGAPAFLACVVLLALSTVLCSWRRTKVALSRARTLRLVARGESPSQSERHELEIACDPALAAADVLSIAAGTLGRLGFRTSAADDTLTSASAPWSVWGSPVFHWALVVLILAAVAGSLVRSEGSMALAVGQAKADSAASYVSVSAGPWHSWSGVDRGIRLDSFDPDFKTGGIDRGAVPTVSVLDASGKAVVTQRVYPNMKLHSGSLSINSPAVGLAASLDLLDASGAQVGQLIQYDDFSQAATGGTVPLEMFSHRDSAGRVQLRLAATVPLDRVGTGYGEYIPAQPSVRLVVTSAGGTTLLDHILRPGESVALPGGGAMRLAGIGWYARLSLVDDPTIPFVYGSMIMAIIGLSVTALVRQQYLVATVVGGPDGVTLALDMRLWHNASTSRTEIVGELARALGSDEKESAS